MATYTENYSLIKPDETDCYDVTDFNENMDMLDSTMAAVETAAADISEKIGTPAETGQTVFSLLNSGGGSVIKSIQRVTISAPTTTVSFNPVDTTKTIAFCERLFNSGEDLVNMAYVLYEDHIKMTTMPTVGNKLTLGFWIVEFV